ncbi:hypothetical protein [Kutzneria sp. CA-103260]|uniref:hypothetical protein n=1 Tax=Kutzneria sp. CA-103260 TaxID=2802641 RepID=UPI001BADE576|nr:hypothetical protein [Kutzneria sp. CA-103260]QUQ71055.1 hypothetical protein JJ691_88380 [Kutzneria sp. CA-103260]
MPALNQPEERHLGSLVDLRDAESIALLDSRHGDIGPAFVDIEPLALFDAEWDDLRLDADMLGDSLRFEVAAHWESGPADPPFAGEYRVPSPMEILSQGRMPSSDMLETEFQRSFAAQLRHIDNAYESSRGFMTFLRMVPGASPLEVWFSDLAGTGAAPYPPGYVKLDLTFTKYVETLLLTKGLHGWQYLFADVSLTDPALQHVTEGLRNGLNALPDIFPGLDYAPLARRLAARL